MKAKSTSRSGSPAKPATKSPAKTAPKSPSKAGGKLSTKGTQLKTASKSPVKDAPKSPSKTKAPSSVSKQPAKQQKPAQRQAMKKTSEKVSGGKSPRPTARSSNKTSQTPKGTEAAKQREMRISTMKTKTKSPSQKKSQDVLRSCKKTPMKRMHTKIVPKTKKKKIERELSTSQFIDLWTLANIGKREASLNASMKVNIMYESTAKSPSKSSLVKTSNVSEDIVNKEEQEETTPKKSVSENKDRAMVSDEKKCQKPTLTISKATKSKKLALSTALKVRQKSGSSSPSKTAQVEQRKRKSPHYKIFKEEPAAKCRKIEPKKAKAPLKSKAKPIKKTKKKKKVAPSGHHLCNIIEKSPRQASLIAKAMIAMEQEEDVVHESAARTKVYDWQELRPYYQNNRRRIVWVSGLAKSIKDKEDKNDARSDIAGKEPSALSSNVTEPSEALHSALLRTLHEVGDPRLLREFYRAQMDDFPGHVDVEKCDPPAPPPSKERLPPAVNASPVKEVSKSPVKVKTVAAAVSPPAKKPPKVGVTDKKADSSPPAKPQPCRVATPIPQFPLGHRTSHMTSFIHHPITHQQQRLQQQQQQKQPFHHQQAPQQAHTHHPQPIKVTPYSPGPAYIYQFVPPPPPSPSPSPLTYGLGGAPSPAPHGDFQSSFTLSHMGALSLGRRGVNPYDQAYNNPVQQVGLGFPSYYQASIQALHQPQGMQSLSNLSSLQGLPNLSNLPSLQNLGNLQPLGVQQFPLVQPAPVVAHQQLPHDVTQFNPLRSNFSYSRMSPGREGAGFVRPQPMMPPPAHSHKPAHMSMGPPSAPPIAPATRPVTSPHRQQQQHHLQQHGQPQQKPCTSPIESLRSMNPQGVQPILQSRVLQFSNPGGAYPQPSAGFQHLSQHVPTQPVSILPKPPTNTPKAVSSQPQPKQQSTSNASHFLHIPSTQCKKELLADTTNSSCDMVYKPPTYNVQVQTKPAASRRTSTEVANISDLLHSVHNAMYETEGGTPPVGARDPQPPPVSTHSSEASPAYSNESHVKSSAGPAAASFNAAYSMSTILDLPSNKMKSEPQPTGSCEYTPQMMQNSLSVVVNSPSNLHIAFPSSVTNRTGSEGSLNGLAVVKKEQEDKPPAKKEEVRKPDSEQNIKEEVINLVEISSGESSAGECSPAQCSVEDSSEDEPLAKLIKRDGFQKPTHKPNPKGKTKCVKSPTKIKILKRVNLNDDKPKKTSVKAKAITVSPIKAKQKPRVSPVKLKTYKKTNKAAEAAVSPLGKTACTKPKVKRTGKAAKSGISKPKKPAPKKARLDLHNAQPLPRPINNHGWSWLGDGYVGPVPKITIAREEHVRMRRCFKSMRHTSGEQVNVGDCVLLQSDGNDSNVPYVARVTRLWETQNGEKMFSMLWYYQPEHTATGREPEDGEQELFASKHREENSVACIDDKCYVLMYNEYCRLEAEAARNDQGVMLPRWREEMPGVSAEDQPLQRKPPPGNACVDNIWFCRYDYDIRKKYVRKPKHKKSSLRYRAPCKLA